MDFSSYVDVNRMITLVRMDTAFRRLKQYDPDLDVSPLTADATSMHDEERQNFFDQTHVIRMTLVARVADIVKQAPQERTVVDAAVAMAEVLISTCGGPDESSGRGHTYAMQAIQLLASIYARLDETIDLFFDLVERSCAQCRSRQSNISSATSVLAPRMAQKYDQTLLKLISRHWSVSGPAGSWDIVRPMQRIKDLQNMYEAADKPAIPLISRLRRKDSAASLFRESSKVLKKVQRQRVTEAMSAHYAGRCWTPASSSKHMSTANPLIIPDNNESSSGFSQYSSTGTIRSMSSGTTVSQSDLSEVPEINEELFELSTTKGYADVTLSEMEDDEEINGATREPRTDLTWFYSDLTRKAHETATTLHASALPEFSAFDFDLNEQVSIADSEEEEEEDDDDHDVY